MRNSRRREFEEVLGPCEVEFYDATRPREIDDVVLSAISDPYDPVLWQVATRPHVDEGEVILAVEVWRAKRDWPPNDAESFRQWAYRVTDVSREQKRQALGFRQLPPFGRVGIRLWWAIDESALLREQPRRKGRPARGRPSRK